MSIQLLYEPQSYQKFSNAWELSNRKTEENEEIIHDSPSQEAASECHKPFHLDMSENRHILLVSVEFVGWLRKSHRQTQERFVSSHCSVAWKVWESIYFSAQPLFLKSLTVFLLFLLFRSNLSRHALHNKSQLKSSV